MAGPVLEGEPEQGVEPVEEVEPSEVVRELKQLQELSQLVLAHASVHLMPRLEQRKKSFGSVYGPLSLSTPSSGNGLAYGVRNLLACRESESHQCKPCFTSSRVRSEDLE